MVSLMSDPRVVFLVWFIAAAVVVAVVLIVVEIRLKRRSVLEAEKKKEKTPIDKMNIFLDKDVGIREKLDVVGKTAKDYFKEEYKMSVRFDYGELAKEFKKIDRELEVRFCEEMFEAYYSNHKLTEGKVRALGSVLGEIFHGKESVKSRILPDSPGIGDRLDWFLEEVRNEVAGKIREYSEVNGEKVKREARVTARQKHELLGWVKRTIHMGYNRDKVVSLLNDGKRDKKEIKQILKIYDKETVEVLKNNSHVRSHGSTGGVAQRILQKEKARLEEAIV